MDLGGIVIEVADEHNWEGSVVTTINVNNNNKLVNADNTAFQVQKIGNTNIVNNQNFLQESEQQYVPQVLEYAVPGVAGAVNVQYGIENESSSGNVQYVQHVPYEYEANNYNVDNLVQKMGTENHMNYSFVNKSAIIQDSTNAQYNDLNNIDQNVSYSVQNKSNNPLHPQIHEVPIDQDPNCQIPYVSCSENNNNAYSQKRPLNNVSFLEKGSIASPKKEKKYICPHCDYKTEVPRSLAIHIRRHTGEKPYLCDECGDSFTNPSDLLRHKIRHTDHREYQCGQCEAAFKDVAGINKHVKKMHYLNPGEISHYRFKEETTDRGEKILFIKVVKDSQPYVRRFRILKS